MLLQLGEGVRKPRELNWKKNSSEKWKKSLSSMIPSIDKFVWRTINVRSVRILWKNFDFFLIFLLKCSHCSRYQSYLKNFWMLSTSIEWTLQNSSAIKPNKKAFEWGKKSEKKFHVSRFSLSHSNFFHSNYPHKCDKSSNTLSLFDIRWLFVLDTGAPCYLVQQWKRKKKCSTLRTTLSRKWENFCSVISTELIKLNAQISKFLLSRVNPTILVRVLEIVTIEHFIKHPNLTLTPNLRKSTQNCTFRNVHVSKSSHACNRQID